MSEKTSPIKERLDGISIIRAISILIVVAFHCYGMMYAAVHFPAIKDIYKQLYYIPNQCVFIQIAMPLFVFVSGYLFQFLLNKGKYPTWINLIKKKGQRIVLPYFVFGLIFMATTGNFHPERLMTGGYWHLWFLPMLFWCFVFGFFLNKILKFISIRYISNILIGVLLFISFIGICVPKFIPMWFGLHNLSKWFYWFILGQTINNAYGIIKNIFERYKFHWLFFFAYILITILHPVEYGKDGWINVLSETFGTVSLCYFANNNGWRKYKPAHWLLQFSSYSFGIYIFHNWVAMLMISNTSKKLFHLESLAANHVVFFPLCFFLLTLLISWGLTWGLNKTKMGKFLIG